jgi:hypothetical protein
MSHKEKSANHFILLYFVVLVHENYLLMVLRQFEHQRRVLKHLAQTVQYTL